MSGAASSMNVGAGGTARQTTLDRLTPARKVTPEVGGRYSRFVGFMKFSLPIVALILVVLVIAWPGIERQSDGFHLTFASIGSDESGAPGMVNARFVGTDGNGRPFLVTATTATQDPMQPDDITLNALQADMTLSNGTWLTLTADRGLYQRNAESLTLSGPVDLYSDLGYEFHAGDTRLDLAAGVAESAQPVSGQGPFGLLNAQSFRFSDNGQRLYFSGKVKLVVEPLPRN